MNNPWEMHIEKIPRKYIQDAEAKKFFHNPQEAKNKIFGGNSYNGLFNKFFKNCPGSTITYNDKKQHLKNTLNKLPPFGDKDKDGIPNIVDSDPYSKKNNKLNKRIKKFI